MHGFCTDIHWVKMMVKAKVMVKTNFGHSKWFSFVGMHGLCMNYFNAWVLQNLDLVKDVSTEGMGKPPPHAHATPC